MKGNYTLNDASFLPSEIKYVLKKLNIKSANQAFIASSQDEDDDEIATYNKVKKMFNATENDIAFGFPGRIADYDAKNKIIYFEDYGAEYYIWKK